MIPSDHFVKFYNEVFKFLDARNSGELEKYYQFVSENQKFHCLELFREKGLAGMYEYWEHIRIEENCDMSLVLEDDLLYSKMKLCPSLSKITDNDGGACPKYCDHCPGWTLPLITEAGFFAIYNIIDRTEPACEFFIYKELDKAQKKLAELLKVYNNDIIKYNF